MDKKLWVEIQDTSGIQVQTLLRGNFESLTFSTGLNGGFKECSLKYLCDLVTAFDWYENRLNYRLLVKEAHETIWDGRISALELTMDGLQITARGFYKNCYDIPYNTGAFPYVAAEHADAIIKEILTGNCSQISNDQTQIDNPGVQIADIAYNDNKYPGVIFDELAGVGDTAANPWYWYIYEDKIFKFKVKNTTLNWQVWLRDLAPGGLSLRRDLDEVWNSIFVDYTAVANTKATTTEAADTTSQTKYGITRRQYLGAGAVTLAYAEAVGDAYLTEYKNTPQVSSLRLNGIVYGADAGREMVAYPLWRVKAGDIIRVNDLVPTTYIATLDALRIFHIKETTYDTDSNTLIIAPDFPEKTVERLLAQANLSGGEWISKLIPYFTRSV